MLTELCALNPSRGLDWAIPLIAYAFARHGKSTILKASTFDSSLGEDFALFALRDAELGVPWFSADRLSALIFELEGVLNHLKGEGPGGAFKVGLEPGGLRVSWTALDRAEASR